MTSTTPTAHSSVPTDSGSWLRVRYRRAARHSGYLLASLPLAIVGFVLAVATMAAATPTLIILLIGTVILAAGLGAAHWLGNIERYRLAKLSHPMPVKRPFRSPGGKIAWIVARLKYGQGWLDLLFQLLNFPIALLGFIVTITWWAVGVASILDPLWTWALPDGSHDLSDLLNLNQSVGTLLHMAGGLLIIFLAPWVVLGMVWLKAAWARVTLGAQSNAELRERVASLTESRAAVVSAEGETLRRIERDLHDGPQQRLMRMSMDLKSARRRLASGDSNATDELLLNSIDHAQDSLAELRTLSRGIAPPILVDRGLPAAIGAAAAQCPIEVETSIELPEGQRYEPPRESAVYFVVTEALTNAAKHSRATQIKVRITTDDGVLDATVTDDGVGGAHVGKGHGLAGLKHRLAGVDGQLEISSLEGQGTVVRALIP